MKRTTVFLYETTECDLKALARRRGRPVADMIREAIGEYVSREKEKDRPSLRFLAIGRSGHTDTAERHEEILFADRQPRASTTLRTAPEPPAAPRPRKPAARARRRSR
jgi:predicted transcriptional regulator